MDLLAWWNLIFLLPFCLALLYVLLLAFGVAAVDHDGGHDVHDLHDGHVGVAGSVLGALGVGRVPLPIILTCLGFSWGFTGWAGNLVLKDAPVVGAFFPAVSVSAAAAVSFIFTSVAARLVARIVPATESYGARNQDLVGRLAEARFTVTESSGRAFLYDARGVPQEVTCRVQPGEAPIPAGSRLLLFAYDKETDSFLACPDPTQSAGPDLGRLGRVP